MVAGRIVVAAQVEAQTLGQQEVAQNHVAEVVDTTVAVAAHSQFADRLDDTAAAARVDDTPYSLVAGHK